MSELEDRLCREAEGYICADCGYLETYVKAHASADLHMIPGFRWVNPQPSEEEC